MGRPKLIDDEKVLAIAREVFVREGAFGSTREIATRSGLSEAALFKRFSTKADLFVAAMAPPVIDIDQIVKGAQALGDAKRGVALLAMSVLDYFRSALPVIIPLLHNPLIGHNAVHRHFGHGQAGHVVQAIARYVQHEIRCGAIGPAVNPFAAATLLVTSVHSIAQFEIMGFHEGTMPSEGLAILLDTMWHGLKPPDGPDAKAARKRSRAPAGGIQRKPRRRT